MRPVTRLLAAGTLLVLAAGCTRGEGDREAGGAPSGGVAPVAPAAPVTTQVWASTGRFSAARCRPPSPTSRSDTGFVEVRGSARNATLWGLVFARVPLPVGEEVKIVWRMTGSGTLRLAATLSDGTPAGRTFGPQAHAGSNWKRPGQEWGTGFVFPKPGCWDLHLSRTSGVGDVWLLAR
ncbi:MAG TPA: hypothetical protein VE776_00285 [Actinomycetota bacterium]|jgi:hypothetical protein|nr:hypothetical protein [Actinomycetota bacterium]